MRILVIDDNEDCAFLLSELIKKCGHETQVAVTAEAGFSKAEEWQPDIVMLDLAMPGGNGYGLASRLRAQAGLHAVKIVAISGYNDDPARRAAAGIDAHLMKPASLHQLMEFFDCEPLELAL